MEYIDIPYSRISGGVSLSLLYILRSPPSSVVESLQLFCLLVFLLLVLLSLTTPPTHNSTIRKIDLCARDLFSFFSLVRLCKDCARGVREGRAVGNWSF